MSRKQHLNDIRQYTARETLKTETLITYDLYYLRVNARLTNFTYGLYYLEFNARLTNFTCDLYSWEFNARLTNFTKVPAYKRTGQAETVYTLLQSGSNEEG